MADVDGDGDQDSGDLDAIDALIDGGGTAITSGNFNVECDIDRSGVIDATDYSIASTDGTRTALSIGALSNLGNTLGYSGYVFNAEVGIDASAGGGGMYTIRFRHYDTGAWKVGEFGTVSTFLACSCDSLP
jgi:hypothetical protein